MIDARSPALNYVEAAGKRSPGVVRITDAARSYNWDIKPGYGLDGAFTVYHGRGVAQPTLTFTLCGRDDLAAWGDFSKVFVAPSTTKPFWVEISHPIFAEAELKKFGIMSVGSPEKQPNGTWVVVVKLVEYRPCAPALVKPRGSIPSESGVPPVPPQTAAQKAVVAATADLNVAKARADKGGG